MQFSSHASHGWSEIKSNDGEIIPWWCTFSPILFLYHHPFSCLTGTWWDIAELDAQRGKPAKPGSSGQIAVKPVHVCVVETSHNLWNLFHGRDTIDPLRQWEWLVRPGSTDPDVPPTSMPQSITSLTPTKAFSSLSGYSEGSLAAKISIQQSTNASSEIF